MQTRYDLWVHIADSIVQESPVQPQHLSKYTYSGVII